MSHNTTTGNTMEDTIKSSSQEYVYDEFDRLHSDDEDEDSHLVIAEDEDDYPRDAREQMPSTITEALSGVRYGPSSDFSPPPGVYNQLLPRKPEIVSPNRHDRMRLRPWLIRQIDSGVHPGLSFLNEEKSLFRIPWMHRSKREWTLEHSGVFVEWAKHTGKYRPGIDTPDFVHMKTRLRCAFNKAPDIEEVAGIQKVKNDIPYKIYRLLPPGSNKFANIAPKPDSDKMGKKIGKRQNSSEEKTKRGPNLRVTIENQIQQLTPSQLVISPINGMMPSPEGPRPIHHFHPSYPDHTEEDMRRHSHGMPAMKSSEAAAVESLVNLGGSTPSPSLARAHSAQGNIVYIYNDGAASFAQNPPGNHSSSSNTVPDTPDSLPAFEELLPPGTESSPSVQHGSDSNGEGTAYFNAIKQEPQSNYGESESRPHSPMEDAVGALLSMSHKEDVLPLRTEVLDLRSNIEDRKPDWDGTGVLDLSTKKADEEVVEIAPPKSVPLEITPENHQRETTYAARSAEPVARHDPSIQGWSVTTEGLQTRFSELIDLENKLMDYKVALDSRAESLASKEAQLNAKEAELHDKVRILSAKERELNHRAAHVEEQDAGVKEKDEEIQACEKQLRLKEELLSCKEKRLKLEVDNLMAAFANGQQNNPMLMNPIMAQSRLLNANNLESPHTQHKAHQPVTSHPQTKTIMMPPHQTYAHIEPHVVEPQVSPPMIQMTRVPRGMITRPQRAQGGLPRHRILPNPKPSPQATIPPVRNNPVSPQMQQQHQAAATVVKPAGQIAQTEEPIDMYKPSGIRDSPPMYMEKVEGVKGMYVESDINKHPSSPKTSRTHDIIQNLRKRVYQPQPHSPIHLEAGPNSPPKNPRILPPV